MTNNVRRISLACVFLALLISVVVTWATIKSYFRKVGEEMSARELYDFSHSSPLQYWLIPGDVKATVFCNDLAANNDIACFWGVVMPDSQGTDRDYGHALVAVGKPAVPLLLPLLDDFSPVNPGLLSLRQAVALQRGDITVADYAYRFLCKILGLPYECDPDLQVRKHRIDQLKKRLALPIQQSPAQ